MRHGSSSRRQRNRNNSGRSGNKNKNQVYDSNGPDVRIRGTAHQVAEKYMNLAKDANGSDDRILAESYLQHAEHYTRIINNWDQELAEERRSSSHTSYKDQERGPSKKSSGKQEEDDLALPSSILGVSQEEQKRTSERTPEMSD